MEVKVVFPVLREVLLILGFVKLSDVFDVSKLKHMAVITRLVRCFWTLLDINFARPKIYHIVSCRELFAYKKFIVFDLLFKIAFHDLVLKLGHRFDCFVAVPLHETAEGGFHFLVVLGYISIVLM